MGIGKGGNGVMYDIYQVKQDLKPADTPSAATVYMSTAGLPGGQARAKAQALDSHCCREYQ